MMTTIFRRLVVGALVMAALAVALVVGVGSASADGGAGAVYTLSNATGGNVFVGRYGMAAPVSELVCVSAVLGSMSS